jgi:hypothetical protein
MALMLSTENVGSSVKKCFQEGLVVHRYISHTFFLHILRLTHHNVKCRVVRATKMTGSSSDDWSY